MAISECGQNGTIFPVPGKLERKADIENFEESFWDFAPRDEEGYEDRDLIGTLVNYIWVYAARIVNEVSLRMYRD
ncbi:hypothetical protein HYW76_00030 [Candidatus Pacearchaeota archaeon]|nr:hypothetical protein [Candidatus Pacearchaeota archaeon]